MRISFRKRRPPTIEIALYGYDPTQQFHLIAGKLDGLGARAAAGTLGCAQKAASLAGLEVCPLALGVRRRGVDYIAIAVPSRELEAASGRSGLSIVVTLTSSSLTVDPGTRRTAVETSFEVIRWALGSAGFSEDRISDAVTRKLQRDDPRSMLANLSNGFEWLNSLLAAGGELRPGDITVSPRQSVVSLLDDVMATMRRGELTLCRLVTMERVPRASRLLPGPRVILSCRLPDK